MFVSCVECRIGGDTVEHAHQFSSIVTLIHLLRCCTTLTSHTREHRKQTGPGLSEVSSWMPGPKFEELDEEELPEPGILI